MKERDLLEWTLDLLARTGWQTWHVPMPVRPVGGGKLVPEPRGAGLPDVIAICPDPPLLMFVELKGDDGKLSDAQEQFLRLARLVGETASGPFYRGNIVGSYVVTPADRDAFASIARSKVLS